MASELERRIVEVIRFLRDGEVVSYGDIANDAGFPGRSRAVGHVLSVLTDTYELPWWRVVNSAGRLVPGHEAEQAQLLRAEGVTVDNGRVKAAIYGRFKAGPVKQSPVKQSPVKERRFRPARRPNP